MYCNQSPKQECVVHLICLTLRDIREDRSAGAEGRARMRSVAVVVEEADLLVEALLEAAGGVAAQTLATS